MPACDGESIIVTKRPLQAALFLSALAMLAACDKKPTGQVVAVVNDEEVTQQELNREIALLNIPKDRLPPDAGAAMLERLVDRNLLADYAREQKLDRSPDFIAARRRMEQALLADMALRKLVPAPAPPTPTEITRFIEANPTLFGEREKLLVDYVRFATPKDPKLVPLLMALPSLDAVAQRLATDKTPFQRGKRPLDTATLEAPLARQIVARPDGALLEMTREDMTVIGAIVQRASAPAPQARWPQIAAAAITRGKLAEARAAALAKLRQSARISYAAKAPGSK